MEIAGHAAMRGDRRAEGPGVAGGIRGILPAERLDALDVDAEAEAWRERLEAPPAEERLWLAVDGDELVGYARTGPCEDVDATPELGEVHGLYAAPERIGTGVGRALLAHAAADLAARGTGRSSSGTSSATTAPPPSTSAPASGPTGRGAAARTASTRCASGARSTTGIGSRLGP